MPHRTLRWALGDEGDPYELAHDLVSSERVAPFDPAHPFNGGAVGFFGYDLVRTVEPLGAPNPDPLGLPDMALMVASLMLAFDHQTHELLDRRLPVRRRRPRRADRAGAKCARAADPRPSRRPHRPRTRSGGARRAFVSVEPHPRGVRAERLDESSSTSTPATRSRSFPRSASRRQVPVEAFSIYRGLRTVNPSPYMYFLDFEDFQIAGASPEPLIKVTGRRVETRPIAGTYPRGSDEEEDRRNAEDLLADPKERAEHVMLVDLGRNDLGRVCEYGTVEVEELMVVETYSHVLHIVSRVAGTLRPEVGAMDALRACLPAGTLSGAPKVRAMQIIDELEPHKRCSYGGAIGYLGFDGDLDTAIHIRTVVVKDGVAHVQAGGGTVADAKPDFEYRESVNKAKAVFSAVELAGEPEGLDGRDTQRHMLLSHLKVLT